MDFQKTLILIIRKMLNIWSDKRPCGSSVSPQHTRGLPKLAHHKVWFGPPDVSSVKLNQYKNLILNYFSWSEQGGRAALWAGSQSVGGIGVLVLCKPCEAKRKQKISPILQFQTQDRKRFRSDLGSLEFIFSWLAFSASLKHYFHLNNTVQKVLFSCSRPMIKFRFIPSRRKSLNTPGISYTRTCKYMYNCIFNKDTF